MKKGPGRPLGPRQKRGVVLGEGEGQFQQNASKREGKRKGGVQNGGCRTTRSKDAKETPAVVRMTQTQSVGGKKEKKAKRNATALIGEHEARWGGGGGEPPNSVCDREIGPIYGLGQLNVGKKKTDTENNLRQPLRKAQPFWINGISGGNWVSK